MTEPTYPKPSISPFKRGRKWRPRKDQTKPELLDVRRMLQKSLGRKTRRRVIVTLRQIGRIDKLLSYQNEKEKSQSLA